MSDNDLTTTTSGDTDPAASPAPRRRRAASRPAGPPVVGASSEEQPPTEPVAKKATRKRSAKAAQAGAPTAETGPDPVTTVPDAAAGAADASPPAPPARRTRKRAAPKPAAEAGLPAAAEPAPAGASALALPAEQSATGVAPLLPPGPTAPGVLFRPPDPMPAKPRRRAAAMSAAADEPVGEGAAFLAEDTAPSGQGGPSETPETGEPEDGESAARRRRRGGRGRRGRGRDRDDVADAGETPDTSAVADAGDPVSATVDSSAGDSDPEATDTDPDAAEPGDAGTRRRRRRRRRGGGDSAEGEDPTPDDPPLTVVRVREPRTRSKARPDRSDDDDGVRAVKGSTRLEAKKQRRREGREAGRRRPSIITEAEFLARRESVDRTMIVRQTGERTQIAVLEDDVLVEHYVSTASGAGLVGNVYLGKVQNVLPSMEAAFVDIGKGRNAVLYAGEVNWDAAGLEGQPRRIELALKSGDPVLAQVTKDPIGHKGARLTSQVSLAGRYLVLVPGGSMTGISRKLPDTERSRLKAVLKRVVPEGAGVIVRTAAEGASEEELARDVARLTAQWEVIEKKSAKGASAPALLYGEPDMTIRVVRDIFNEDFARLVISGDEAWEMLEPYVAHVAPDLRERMSRWTDEKDVFTAHRVDEQLAKALDRKVWLPSGGYLVIDRTEAMIVVDVNTGKFTGAGGNLEETVTKNNLEAAEEIVRQLRLRDLGGIIVMDFIDMVLESNRDLVLRRLLECLGRDRTKHQVAEVTSLGLVQMTRKRVGQGLHEVFAEACDACNGRGYHMRTEPVDHRGGNGGDSADRNGASRGDSRRGNGRGSLKPTPLTALTGRRASTEPDQLSEPVTELDQLSEPVTEAAAGVDPVAVEDPVEPAVAVLPADEVPARKPRRRRAAVSPVTTL